LKESERNVAIRVSEQADSDSFEVAGRGELQLGILIETMRREGFELTVSRPRVVMKRDPVTGQKLEPIEVVIIDVDEAYCGIVVQKLSERRGDLVDMRRSGGARQRLVLHVPTRGLIGYHGELLTDTRGTAVMNRSFHGYAPFKGEIAGRRTGVLISNAAGEATAYSLYYLEDRGAMIIDPQTRVYAGMIVGQHTRDNDLVVNVVQGKKLSNVRAAGKDEALTLTPPLRLTLERALTYIADDELVEVTPKSIRLRKRWLDPNERKKRERALQAEQEAV
jgi:GTP-binding protein